MAPCPTGFVANVVGTTCTIGDKTSDFTSYIAFNSPPLPRNLTASGCQRTLPNEFAHHSGVAQGTTWRLCRR
jgi:hypothetical protein